MTAPKIPRPPAPNDAKHRALPIVATDQMIEAAYPLLSSMTGGSPARDKKIIRAVWDEMVAATPKPTMHGLTKNQLKVHQFVEAYIAQHQLSPTYDEISEGCGFGGRDEAYVVVMALERKKVLKRRQKGQPRSLIVLIPSGMKPKKKYIFTRGTVPRVRGPKRGT
tara:strand:+ start:2426 stop:2920 length:495 start_codon:yes stop_codon:yes gene_type:complete